MHPYPLPLELTVTVLGLGLGMALIPVPMPVIIPVRYYSMELPSRTMMIAAPVRIRNLMIWTRRKRTMMTMMIILSSTILKPDITMWNRI